MNKTRLVGALCAAGATSMGLASPALASEVRTEGDTVVFSADPGERNIVLVTQSITAEGKIAFKDDNTKPRAGAGCTVDPSDGWAICEPAAKIRVETGDMGDELRVSSSLILGPTLVMDGGPGDDYLEGFNDDRSVLLVGGENNDTIKGGRGNDTLEGGDGNDEISDIGGNDQLSGGAGDDALQGDSLSAATGSDVIDGGPGLDSSDTDWPGSEDGRPISVTLDGVANDGREGENDNVLSVEVIETARPGTLVAGAEAVRFRILNAKGPASLTGGPGNDVLRAYDYADTVQGGAGADEIEGGNGNDTIDPGPGADTVIADAHPDSCNFLVCRFPAGNDVIEARDGEVDNIDCGVGTDRVVADKDDVVSGCENVELPGGGAGGAKLLLRAAPVAVRTALDRGLKVRVAKAGGARVAVRALYKGRVIGKGSSRTAAGKATVRVVFTPSARRSLRAKRTLRITLVSGTARRSLTLKG